MGVCVGVCVRRRRRRRAGLRDLRVLTPCRHGCRPGVRRSSDVRNGLAKGSLLSLAVVGVIYFFEIAFFPSHLFQRQQGEAATGFGHVRGYSHALSQPTHSPY